MNTDGPVLRDIHLPPAAWWPLAPGWWLLAALVLLVAAVVAWWLWRRARRRPLIMVMREIDALAAAFAHDADPAGLAEGASRLLRRVARRIDPVAATLDGEAWREFLHGHAGDTATCKALDGLMDARFRAQPSLDAPVLLAALRTWCRDALRGRGLRRKVLRRTGARSIGTRATTA